MAEILEQALDKEGFRNFSGKVKKALAGKQDVLSGKQGQVVGFDAKGKPVAQGTESLVGPAGKDGTDGRDGVSVTHKWNGSTLTVTSASGTSSADLRGPVGASGKDGATGAKGDPGLFYGTCGTSGDTSEKIVSCEGFTLRNGAVVAVKFANGNGAENPTLNVNGTGAKPIVLYGTLPAKYRKWQDGAIVEFIYEGTNWVMVGGDHTAGLAVDGREMEPTSGETVTAGWGAEIFNDYQPRGYAADEGHTEIVAQYGNVATGTRSHAEGAGTSATGSNSHAEGAGTLASGNASHAEGGRFTGKAGSKATAYGAHAEGTSTEASGGGAHSEGRGTKAQGVASHAEGENTTASGKDSHAEGSGSTATSPMAHAEGQNNTASGQASHVEGGGSTASGLWSHAEGENTVASDRASHAEGQYCQASGFGAHAEGAYTTANGISSHAEGSQTKALGGRSHASGSYTIATELQFVVGQNNVQSGDIGVWNDATLNYLIVGKGTGPSSRANCFRVTGTGVYATGAHNTSGADYAELFEWADGNPEGEDRVGRFVTLEGEKLRLAAPGDDFILGIVSGCPSVVGDVYDDQWQGMFLTDIFGRPIYEDKDFPAELGPDGEIIIPSQTRLVQKVNPDYDSNEKYIARTERPEWDAVGMLGKLVALDDGTCQLDGWCRVGPGGVATASVERTRYRVMSRLDESHIRVLIL